MKTESKQRRMSAEERREDILRAAIPEFARFGLSGTSTETIAARAGISQPYLFRLFGTKRDLFLAAVHRGFDQVEEVFGRAADEAEGTPLEAMGTAYAQVLGRRDELLLQLQAYAAAADPEVQVVVRQRFAQLYQYVEQRSGASADEVRMFFGMGMLLNVAAALQLREIFTFKGEEWIGRCFPDFS